jgi:hypothetical protein
MEMYIGSVLEDLKYMSFYPLEFWGEHPKIYVFTNLDVLPALWVKVL